MAHRHGLNGRPHGLCVTGLLAPPGCFSQVLPKEYGETRREASLAIALASLTAGLWTPVIGWAIDRHDVRPIIPSAPQHFPRP